MIHIQRVVADDFKQLRNVDLRLPRRGRFFVHGMNEAGKSTLFEAVYCALFGRPLVTETSHARLDDVIRYGAKEASLDVTVGVDGGRSLRVSRRIRRGRPNVWQLDVISPDGAVEEVRGNSIVNERIAAELKLDGDALLNTCFVEQKKLEKLEGMSRAMREQSLMKLLNLDRLVEMADELKVRTHDMASLARLRERAQLAVLQAELPEVESELARVKSQLALAEATSSLQELRAQNDQLTELRAKAAAADKDAQTARERADKAEAYRAVIQRLSEGRTSNDRAAEARADALRTRAELDKAVHARDVGVPGIIERGKSLRRLQDRHQRLADTEEERKELVEAVRLADLSLDEVAAGRERLNDTRRALVREREAARELGAGIAELTGDVRAFQVRDALRDWQAAAGPMPVEAGSVDELAEARDRQSRAARRARVETGTLALLTALSMVAALWWRPIALGTAVFLVLLVWRWWATGRSLSELAEQVGRIEGEADARTRDEERLAARAAEAEERLRSLNVVRPATSERARAAVEELDERLGDRRRADVDAELSAAQGLHATAKAQVMQLEALESEFRKQFGDVDAAALGRERDVSQIRADRLGQALDRLTPRIDSLAQDLGVERNDSEIGGQLVALRDAVKAERARAADVPALQAQLTQADAKARQHSAAAEEAWQAMPASEEIGEWSVALTDADWESAASALTASYGAAGGDKAKRQAAELGRSASVLAGEVNSGQRALALRVTELQQTLSALAVVDPQLPAEPSSADIDQVLTVLGPMVTVEVAQLEPERVRLSERVNVVRHEVQRLVGDLGADDSRLDVAATETAFREAERSIEVRRRAEQIVDNAGRNVVKRVLPSTIEHMRRLLPALTDGRYFDAQLGDDYRIQVYDDRAGTWKQKNIFSGGTRDQLSLALRLAFALATLPAERGAAPSFLFLDEPLGAFDSQRASALVYLLTEGEIAESFDQVFLISHVSVEPQLFDYHITMDEGRVVDSNL